LTCHLHRQKLRGDGGERCRGKEEAGDLENKIQVGVSTTGAEALATISQDRTEWAFKQYRRTRIRLGVEGQLMAKVIKSFTTDLCSSRIWMRWGSSTRVSTSFRTARKGRKVPLPFAKAADCCTCCCCCGREAMDVVSMLRSTRILTISCTTDASGH